MLIGAGGDVSTTCPRAVCFVLFASGAVPSVRAHHFSLVFAQHRPTRSRGVFDVFIVVVFHGLINCISFATLSDNFSRNSSI